MDSGPVVNQVDRITLKLIEGMVDNIVECTNRAIQQPTDNIETIREAIAQINASLSDKISRELMTTLMSATRNSHAVNSANERDIHRRYLELEQSSWHEKLVRGIYNTANAVGSLENLYKKYEHVDSKTLELQWTKVGDNTHITLVELKKQHRIQIMEDEENEKKTATVQSASMRKIDVSTFRDTFLTRLRMSLSSKSDTITLPGRILIASQLQKNYNTTGAIYTYNEIATNIYMLIAGDMYAIGYKETIIRSLKFYAITGVDLSIIRERLTNLYIRFQTEHPITAAQIQNFNQVFTANTTVYMNLPPPITAGSSPPTGPFTAFPGDPAAGTRPDQGELKTTSTEDEIKQDLYFTQVMDDIIFHRHGDILDTQASGPSDPAKLRSSFLPILERLVDQFLSHLKS